MEIVTSRVSVYEIELVLSGWKFASTHEVPGFYEALTNAMITLKEHKCTSGEPGGFYREVREGTHFAHVIEHVILELIHLADRDENKYTGWTRQVSEDNFIIHYSAPDFLTARLAAILGVDLVKKLVHGDAVDVERSIRMLRKPAQYFSQEEPMESGAGLVEPKSVIEELNCSAEMQDQDISAPPALTPEQISNLCTLLDSASRHMRFITESWRNAFLKYCGEFGKSIIDKVGLINIDRFSGFLEKGEFDCFFRSVQKVCHVIKAYGIPDHFVVHSTWLFKNKLLTYIIEEFRNQRDPLRQAVSDIDLMYRIILSNISKGFLRKEQETGLNPLRELIEFRELKKGRACILIVDDDDMMRRAGRDILELHGYRALTARDGREALELLLEKRNEIALVVLDLVLPGISGQKTFSSIQNLLPELKVLVTSGYPVNQDTRDLFKHRAVDFIDKPFRARTFIQKVQKLLGGQEEGNGENELSMHGY
ncbi:MAG: response regulator [Planctomycetota bacterium]